MIINLCTQSSQFVNDRHNITEMLLKVTLNTIKPNSIC